MLRSIFGFEQSILTPLLSSPPWPLSRRNILVMLHNFFTTQALADLKADTAESTEDGTFSSKHFASQITKGQQPSFVISIRRGNMVAEATKSTPFDISNLNDVFRTIPGCYRPLIHLNSTNSCAIPSCRAIPGVPGLQKRAFISFVRTQVGDHS